MFDRLIDGFGSDSIDNFPYIQYRFRIGGYGIGTLLDVVEKRGKLSLKPAKRGRGILGNKTENLSILLAFPGGLCTFFTVHNKNLMTELSR